jgi:Cu2+-exporting ATPase
LASLLYDGNIITSEAIARYVTRATGFGTKPLGRQDGGDNSPMTLPLKFAVEPPSLAFEPYDVRRRPELGGFVEVTFPVRGEHARQPRDVMKELEQFQPRLLPGDVSELAGDRVLRDLRNVAWRTIAASLLSIPVLVIAWAPLHERPFVYGVVSVILTTFIQVRAIVLCLMPRCYLWCVAPVQIIGFPIVSSSIRALLYMREVDMGLLVTVSTLTAYIFSVIAFAFETAGEPFTESFFETPALLVSLIYVGRLVQAASRKSAGSAVSALQELRMSDVLLLETSSIASAEAILDIR